MQMLLLQASATLQTDPAHVPGWHSVHARSFRQAVHSPAMYCSTRADTFSPSPLTASMPAPLAAGPGTALSNLQRECEGADEQQPWLEGERGVERQEAPRTPAAGPGTALSKQRWARQPGR